MSAEEVPIQTKHGLEAATEPEAKRARVDITAGDESGSSVDQTISEAVSAALSVDLAEVRRQIEYYFSDESLRYDHFFHPKISADPEGWLPLPNILSCKRIQKLRATAEDIAQALRDSHLQMKQDTESGQWSVRRLSPLPPLEERPPRPERSDREGNRRIDSREKRDRRGNGRPDGRADDKNLYRITDFHSAGCLVRIKGIPEEASWETVKVALCAHLPTPPQPTEPGRDGRERKPIKAIQFVSMPDAKGECTALLTSFADDKQWISGNAELQKIDINGAKVAVQLLEDANEALRFVRALPGPIKKAREREILAKSKELGSKPITVGGVTFVTIGHLRYCLTDTLKGTPAGSTLNTKLCTVLRHLLTFHPEGKQKLEEMVGFKVDLHATAQDGQERTKCFYVIKADGSTESFSVTKAIVEMEKNPPYAVPDGDANATEGASKEACMVNESAIKPSHDIPKDVGNVTTIEQAEEPTSTGSSTPEDTILL